MEPPVHVFLQARMNSSRLPGKALMPMAGHPSAVLAALRASRGRDWLTVATADAPSCDALAAALQAAGLRVFRGAEEDVLGRFAAAAAGLQDETILVRLTADNMFPDADFVALLVQALKAKAVDIVGTPSAKGLPYGLSGEAFRLGALRRAAASTDALYDREHVTPWLYRHCRTAAFDSLDHEMDLSSLRCTLDTGKDYQRLLAVFETIRDPVGIGWRELVSRLKSLQEQHA
jgi:spore coat polysaccharide biosynthesis protein SpsF